MEKTHTLQSGCTVLTNSPLNDPSSVLGRNGEAGDAPDDVLGGRPDGEVQRDHCEGPEGADIGPGHADLRDAAPHRGAHGAQHWDWVSEIFIGG